MSEATARVGLAAGVRDSAWRRRLRDLAGGRPGALELLVALAIYLGFACYFTWPLITDLGHTFYGGAGDPYGTMAFYRELVAHHHNPFLPGTISQFNSPEGQPIPWTRDLASMPGVLAQYLLTLAFGTVPANGLYALLGYTLTGLVTFAFVRRLTGSAWIALIAGWAFAFYPFAILNGQGHDDNVQGWVLVLGVWRMLELTWHPSRRNGVLAGLAVVFGMWWSPYFILFGGAAYVAAAFGALLIGWRAGRLRQTLSAEAVSAVIVLAFLAFLGILSTGPGGNSVGVRTNGIAQFNTYSARPLEYLIPDKQSPVFGSTTGHYLETHLHGSNSTEATLYVGITIILLNLVALVALLRGKLPERMGQAVFLLMLIALVALITSAPPEVNAFGILIPFPSHFIAEVTSTWRVYARFVIIVMLAMSAIAGVGLYVLTRGRAQWIQVVILLLASVLVPLDLWGRLGGRTNTIETPRVYTALAREPYGLVAQYPLTGVGENLYNELFFQDTYRMPLINGYLEDTAEERRALSLAVLANPSTGPRLAALGVRYVVLESTPPGYGLPLPGKPGRGFRLLYQEPYGSLYLVTAQPSGPALPAADGSFGDDEETATGTLNWLEQPSGGIALAGNCTRCRGVLTMTVSSFAQPRVVTVTSADGRVLARLRVVGPSKLAVPLEFARHTTVELTAIPGPQSITKTTGAPDPRSVSVQVGNLEFTGSAGPPTPRSH